jgi:hypothetical protein
MNIIDLDQRLVLMLGLWESDMCRVMDVASWQANPHAWQASTLSFLVPAILAPAWCTSVTANVMGHVHIAALSSATATHVCCLLVLRPAIAGQYAGRPGMSACEEAPAGYFIPLQGAMAPQACPVNTYQDEPGQDACKACPGGYCHTRLQTSGAVAQQETPP